MVLIYVTSVIKMKCAIPYSEIFYLVNTIFARSWLGYTAVTGLQSFSHPRVCRCCGGFRFKHPQCISHNTRTMHRFLFSLGPVRFPRGVNSVASFANKMVEEIMQVTSEYEERLWRCKDVPRFSCEIRTAVNKQN